MSTKVLRVGVVGVSGYVGQELARLVLQHPSLDLAMACSRGYAGEPLVDIIPPLCGFTQIKVCAPEPQKLSELDVVFLAVPHGAASEIAGQLRREGAGIIVDMSADHRHHPEWVYGQPEWNHEQLSGRKNLSIPGCFATAVALALAPLAKAQRISGPVSVNAITGSTGSGANAKAATHHPERFTNLKAYKVLNHQHVPEITAFLAQWGFGQPLQMVPQSGPFDRGIFATCFVPLSSNASVSALYEDAYADQPLIRVRPSSPELRWVRGTGFCDLGVFQTSTHAVILSAIDNLGRGASIQGIQALNVSMGWEATRGIWNMPLTP